MPRTESLEAFSTEAKEYEKRYDWLGAVSVYDKAVVLASKLKDFAKTGEFQNRIGYCYLRAADQSRSWREFESRIKLAVEVYERAINFFEKVKESIKWAKVNHCKAIIAYINSRLSKDPAKRKALLNEGWNMVKKALKAYRESGDSLEYGRACNELLLNFSDYLYFMSSWQEVRRNLEEVIHYCETAATRLSKQGDEREVALAYSLTGGSYVFASFYQEPEKRKQFVQKALSYGERSVRLCEKLDDGYIISVANHTLGDMHPWLTGNLELAQNYAEKALYQAAKTKDNRLIGEAMAQLAHILHWKTTVEENPEKARQELREGIQYASESSSKFLSIVEYSGAAYGYAQCAECYSRLAEMETDANERRVILEKAVEAARKSLDYADASGSFDAIHVSLHALSKALYFFSMLQTEVDEKKNLLEESMKHRERGIRIYKQFCAPFEYWNSGVFQNYLGLIKAELAKIEADRERKIGLLVEAISNMENCVNLCKKHIEQRPQTPRLSVLGGYYEGFGRTLEQLYSLTREEEILNKEVEVFTSAIEAYSKADLPSRVAEAYWRIARVHDRLGQYLQAATNFQLASREYRTSAEKMLQLQDLYSNHATYMQAWSEIEKARYNHLRGEYAQSKEHYEQAAKLHESSGLWSYLAPSYSAWELLEHAEELSRSDESQKAIKAFGRAAELFSKAKKSIKENMSVIESPEEKSKAEELIKASDRRNEYCTARIIVEEAKIHDTKGNYAASAEKYGLAAHAFQKILEVLDNETDRKEIQPTVLLCQAWHKTKMAETEASPEAYIEAAKLFEMAKEVTDKEKISLLASGNSCFCKALCAGTRFKATREMEHYHTAKQYMESASDYYVDAGFISASKWVDANMALFDAYGYKTKAESEIDHKKKLKLYQLAERYLERSIELHAKAGYVGKLDTIRRILAKVREKRKFALSLHEVLEAPSIATSTAGIAAPLPTHEEALGLQKFEHANIHVHLKAPETVTTGEELEVRLDLINIARNFGLLVRVDNILPKGLKVTKVSPEYTIENGSIDIKGKRLHTLKVESIKISALAIETGVFNLNPKVVYVDDTGEFQTSRPETIQLTVLPSAVLQFKTDAAQKIFNYLIAAFLEDYMRLRLHIQSAGWRSLVQVSRNAEVPRSSLYGARGRYGPAVAELERRGLVETRFFSGERGRGGKILKIRIFYDKEPVKRFVDQHVMKIKEK